MCWVWVVSTFSAACKRNHVLLLQVDGVQLLPRCNGDSSGRPWGVVGGAGSAVFAPSACFGLGQFCGAFKENAGAGVVWCLLLSAVVLAAADTRAAVLFPTPPACPRPGPGRPPPPRAPRTLPTASPARLPARTRRRPRLGPVRRPEGGARPARKGGPRRATRRGWTPALLLPPRQGVWPAERVGASPPAQSSEGPPAHASSCGLMEQQYVQPGLPLALLVALSEAVVSVHGWGSLQARACVGSALGHGRLVEDAAKQFRRRLPCRSGQCF